MTSPSENDISLAATNGLNNYVGRIAPTEPYIGYIQLIECLDAWRSFSQWLDKEVPVTSPGRVQTYVSEDEADHARIALTVKLQELTEVLTEHDPDLPPSIDHLAAEIARKAIELLAGYIRHVAAYINPTMLEQDKMRAYARLKGRVERLLHTALLSDAVEEAQQATSEAKRAAKAAREAVAGLAANRLSKTYSQYAKTESTFAWGFLGAAIVITIGVGIYAFLSEVPAELSISQAIQHIATLAVALGLAGFLANQSGRHRTNATWSQVVGVQLTTLDDYLGPVESPEARDQMRLMFAARAFGSAPDDTSGTGNDLTWIQQLVTAAVNSRKSE
jgi:hypothetical protein